MRIIKLDATDSTNAYLKNVLQTEVLDDFTIVIANEQLKGRGQLGARWQSEAGKNLTISVLKKFHSLKASDQFFLNMAVSIAVYNTLKVLEISNLSIKWPNDILSGKQKICGILIENVLYKQNISSSIIGIGLNVNQVEFPGLQRATSVKLQKGEALAIEEVLKLLLKELEGMISGLEDTELGKIKAAYEALLFRRDKPSTFMVAGDLTFTAYIRGISDSGKLIIEVEDGILREYALKDIRLLY